MKELKFEYDGQLLLILENNEVNNEISVKWAWEELNEAQIDELVIYYIENEMK